MVGLPVPRHQFVDAFLRPAVDEVCQQIREIGLRIDAVKLAGLDQGRQAGPVFPAFITTRKKTIFPRKTNWPHGSLNTVVVEFDSSILEKSLQPIPVVQRVADGLGGRATGGQFRKLRLEPDT